MIKTYIWTEHKGTVTGEIQKWEIKDFRKAFQRLQSRIRNAQMRGAYVDGAEIRLNDVIIWEYDGE